MPPVLDSVVDDNEAGRHQFAGQLAGGRQVDSEAPLRLL
jgi:hypothetical protein